MKISICFGLLSVAVMCMTARADEKGGSPSPNTMDCGSIALFNFRKRGHH